ncbi:MAG: TIGR03790 family protein [Vicinamibacterales bacterium]
MTPAPPPTAPTRLTLRLLALTGLALAMLTPTRAAQAQTVENVLLVINADSPNSVEVGDYYVAKRAIPPEQVIRIKTVTTEAVGRSAYETTIEAPIALALARRSLQDQILYIVLTKGVPLRIGGTGGRDGTVASVDSELTLLYRKLVGQSPTLVGSVENPFYLAERPLAEARPFTHFSSDIYLVTRLDGFTVADVRGLIDRGVAPAANGAIVLDQKATLGDRGGDRWLQSAADRLKAAPGARVILDATPKIASETGPVLGYYSWGSNDPSNQLRRFGLSFVPGAIGGMFVSTDGRTFVEPPASWQPSNPNGGPVFRGSFQSLAGDLIRDGITGISAHVEEPYLDATVRPQVLFPVYVAGFNLAESFYLAMPFLSWQNIVIGDPLCRPFPGKTLTTAQIAKPLDPDTELPGLFSDRRLALASQGGENPAAVKLMLRKDAQVARGITSNVEALLIRATEIDPRFVDAHLQLALKYESDKAYDKAVERYRRVLAINPDEHTALNNLAFVLAVYQKSPKEALPFAERAYRLAKQPAVIDTLGWVHHLNGDDRAAAFFLEEGLRSAPEDPDLLLHAAAVHVALNDLPRARAEWIAAGKLGAAVTGREDYKSLEDQLKRP